MAINKTKVDEMTRKKRKRKKNKNKIWRPWLNVSLISALNFGYVFFLLNIDVSTIESQNSLTTRFSYPSHLLFRSKSNKILFQNNEKITIFNGQILFFLHSSHTMDWIFSLLLCCRLSHSRNTEIFLRNWTELSVSETVYFFPFCEPTQLFAVCTYVLLCECAVVIYVL